MEFTNILHIALIMKLLLVVIQCVSCTGVPESNFIEIYESFSLSHPHFNLSFDPVRIDGLVEEEEQVVQLNISYFGDGNLTDISLILEAISSNERMADVTSTNDVYLIESHSEQRCISNFTIRGKWMGRLTIKLTLVDKNAVIFTTTEPRNINDISETIDRTLKIHVLQVILPSYDVVIITATIAADVVIITATIGADVVIITATIAADVVIITATIAADVALNIATTADIIVVSTGFRCIFDLDGVFSNVIHCP